VAVERQTATLVAPHAWPRRKKGGGGGSARARAKPPAIRRGETVEVAFDTTTPSASSRSRGLRQPPTALFSGRWTPRPIRSALCGR